MQVLNDLKQRGVRDIVICCVEGLTGFPEAIEAIFPQTTVQTCIVHLIDVRASPGARARSPAISSQSTPPRTPTGRRPSSRPSTRRGQRFPVTTKAWLDAWEHVMAFLAFPEEVRRVIYTSNAIEAFNRQLQGDQDQGQWFIESVLRLAVLSGLR